MATYGVKFVDGMVIKVRTFSHEAAKFKAAKRRPGIALHSVWPIGRFWDENGEPIIDEAAMKVSEEKWRKIMQPLIDNLENSERLTAEDLATRVY